MSINGRRKPLSERQTILFGKRPVNNIKWLKVKMIHFKLVKLKLYFLIYVNKSKRLKSMLKNIIQERSRINGIQGRYRPGTKKTREQESFCLSQTKSRNPKKVAMIFFYFFFFKSALEFSCFTSSKK